VYPRLLQRIRARAAHCFMALILHRVMRMRMRSHKSQTGLTPERALHLLNPIQHHRVPIKGAQPVASVSTVTTKHKEMLEALKIKAPSHARQVRVLSE
jgi:hypothetical protein